MPTNILTDEIALLDATGRIVSVNDAWRAFGSANAGDAERTGVGMSYLEICAAAQDSGSRQIASAIRAAITGELLAPVKVGINCSADGREEPFDVLVAGRWDPAGSPVGAVVCLSPARHSDSAVHRALVHELLTVGADLQQLLTLQKDPARATLDDAEMQDLRAVVGRLHNALLGSE